MAKLTTVGALCLTVLIGATACARRPRPTAVPAQNAATEAPPPAPPAMPEPAPPPSTETDDEAFARKTLEELNAERPMADVSFEYNSSTLRDSDRHVLETNARWMQRWATTQVTVEGHCDSRGTAEYNLALGDRRAAAVKNYLLGLGVIAERIAVVSKGKEQPVCHEQTEDCWQRNRRGHFLITAK
jgi:peptidoglycan-associated lipoprotein